MSEPASENPKASKRSKRKPAMEPLGWDEIVSQPGMGGYLSFLNGPVPLPHLQGSAPAAAADPGVDSVPEPGAASQIEPALGIGTTTPIATAPGVVYRKSPEVDSIPLSKTTSDNLAATPVSPRTPGVVSVPIVATSPRLRIRKCAAAHDGHSLGEEVLYQALWKAGNPESDETKTIVIGWRGMSQLCRMTPKNCKINTQRLIRKLALEVLSPYNTPESIGTTYRIYASEAILRRRRDQGLEWVVRSRGVEFVDPATGATLVAHLCTNVLA